MKEKLEWLYQFLSGARYASDGRASDAFDAACMKIEEILWELNSMNSLTDRLRGMSVPVDMDRSKD